MRNVDSYQANVAARIRKLKVISWIVCILIVIPVVVEVVLMLSQEGTGTSWFINTSAMNLSGLSIIFALSRLIMVYERKAERPNRFNGFLAVSIAVFVLATVMSLVYFVFQINGLVRPQVFGWISIFINLIMVVIFIAGIGWGMYNPSRDFKC